MAIPAAKLPIGTRAPGVADPADIASVVSPLRRRGGAASRLSPGKAASQTGPASVLAVGSPTASPSSYREQLRANGLGALQRSRATGGKLTPTQAPSPTGSLTFFPPPPSFGAAHATAVGQDAAARALPQLELPTQDASARSPPPALPPTLPPTTFTASAPPFVPGAVVTWADVTPSPVASTGFVTPGPSTATANFFDMSQVCEPPRQQQPQQQVSDLMSIAMPHAACNALEREQLAAQLRAAAPDSYED